MKKMLAMLLTIVMVLSLCTVAFATDTTTVTPVLPTGSTAVESIPGIASIKVNGDTAVYQTDSNGITYIRAIDNPDSNGNGGTEWALRHATVEFTRTGTDVQMLVNGVQINPAATTVTLTLDMFNMTHAVVINGTSYVLAAGLPSGAVAIDAEDPLRMSSVTVNGTTVTETATNAGGISATNIQNPYIGNATASKGDWTYITYKADIACTHTIGNRASVSASYTLNGATAVLAADTNSSCLIAANTFKLDDPSPRLEVTTTDNGRTMNRDYYIFATDSSTFTVNFGIDFTEAMADAAYTGDVKTKVDTLNRQAKKFFGTTNGHAYGTITVTSGETVMDIMRKFAVKYGYGDDVPAGCTYMAKLNGIGEFTFGSMSGWMYKDSPSWDSTGAALYTTWNTPPVGGASYTLTEGDTICWFICCDYTHHPWN